MSNGEGAETPSVNHYEILVGGIWIPVESEEVLDSLAEMSVPELHFGNMIVRTSAILAIRSVSPPEPRRRVPRVSSQSIPMI